VSQGLSYSGAERTEAREEVDLHAKSSKKAPKSEAWAIRGKEGGKFFVQGEERDDKKTNVMGTTKPLRLPKTKKAHHPPGPRKGTEEGSLSAAAVGEWALRTEKREEQKSFGCLGEGVRLLGEKSLSLRENNQSAAPG